MLLKVWKTFPINHIVGKWQKYFRTCNVCLLDISVVYKFRKCVKALAHNISSHGLSVFVVFIYFMVHYQACYELVWHSDLIYFMYRVSQKKRAHVLNGCNSYKKDTKNKK